MSQNIEDKANAAETRTQETRGFMQQVRVAARHKYTPEEKVRIVMEGFRREVGVSDLCRREGIKPGAFYAWTKDFTEAGLLTVSFRTRIWPTRLARECVWQTWPSINRKALIWISGTSFKDALDFKPPVDVLKRVGHEMEGSAAKIIKRRGAGTSSNQAKILLRLWRPSKNVQCNSGRVSSHLART
ncbi:MAG: transposase [Dehalococcoidia bacterium]|nr:transposase [Dehalococcoidia bacterium]